MKTIRGVSSTNLSLAIAVSDLPSHLRGAARAVLTFAPTKRDSSPAMLFTYVMLGELTGVSERQAGKLLRVLVHEGVLLQQLERVQDGKRREAVRYLNADWFLDCANRLCEREEDYLREAGERIKAYSEVVELEELSTSVEPEDDEEEPAPEPTPEPAPKPESTVEATPQPAGAIPASIRTAFEALGKSDLLTSLPNKQVEFIGYAVTQVGATDSEVSTHIQDALKIAGSPQGTVMPRKDQIATWTARRIKELLIDADLRMVLTAVERDALVTPKGTEQIDLVNQRAHSLKSQGVDLAATLSAGRQASTTTADTYREGPAAWFLHWGFKNVARGASSVPSVEATASTKIDPRLAALIV